MLDSDFFLRNITKYLSMLLQSLGHPSQVTNMRVYWNAIIVVNVTASSVVSMRLDLGDESLPSCDSLYENSLFLLKGEDLKWLTTAKKVLQSDPI
jgi:hypothetical protein